jgi:hypothetical protein
MIEIKLIPDGNTEVPPEAADHGLLESFLNSNANPSENSPMSDWHDVERVVPGHRRYIILRLPGTLEDESQTTRDAVTGAIVNQINGIKEHPDGWQDVDR